MSSQGFTFQIYKVPEINSQLRNNLGIESTEERLNNPTPETVIAYYEALYSSITDTSKQDLHQPQFDAVFISDHLELHEESFPHIDFAHGL